MNVILALILPFIGTTLGALMVFFMKNKISNKLERCLMGFASGVMIAASIWSLIIPSVDASAHLKKLSFLPASIGIILGIVFLLALDLIIPHIHINEDKPEGFKSNFKRQTMTVLAVTLHNIPEGMAIGVAISGALAENSILTMSSAIALSIGIAIQNFPEGAIVSMPLKSCDISKRKSFLYGMLSGIVEPIASALTILVTSFITPILPYLLSFAAGAMIYVVVEELIPKSQEGESSKLEILITGFGFIIMMILDILLG